MSVTHLRCISLAPGTHHPAIQRGDVVGPLDLVDPGFDLAGFLRVLSTRHLDAGLQFSKRDRRNHQLSLHAVLHPGQDTRRWANPAQLGDDVRVDQVHGSPQAGWPAPAKLPTAMLDLEPRTGRQQQLLQRRRLALAALPLSHGNEHRGLDPPPGDHLWTLLKTCLDELAEAGLRLLQLPVRRGGLHAVPRQEAEPRPAMTENGRYVVYALGWIAGRIGRYLVSKESNSSLR